MPNRPSSIRQVWLAAFLCFVGFVPSFPAKAQIPGVNLIDVYQASRVSTPGSIEHFFGTLINSTDFDIPASDFLPPGSQFFTLQLGFASVLFRPSDEPFNEFLISQIQSGEVFESGETWTNVPVFDIPIPLGISPGTQEEITVSFHSFIEGAEGISTGRIVISVVPEPWSISIILTALALSLLVRRSNISNKRW